MTAGREIIRFTINEKIVVYSDRKTPPFRVYPMDTDIVKRYALSSNIEFKALADRIVQDNTGDSLLEYQSCKNDEDVAEKIRNDCKLKGLREIKIKK